MRYRHRTRTGRAATPTACPSSSRRTSSCPSSSSRAPGATATSLGRRPSCSRCSRTASAASRSTSATHAPTHACSPSRPSSGSGPWTTSGRSPSRTSARPSASTPSRCAGRCSAGRRSVWPRSRPARRRWPRRSTGYTSAPSARAGCDRRTTRGEEAGRGAASAPASSLHARLEAVASPRSCMRARELRRSPRRRPFPPRTSWRWSRAAPGSVCCGGGRLPRVLNQSAAAGAACEQRTGSRGSNAPLGSLLEHPVERHQLVAQRGHRGPAVAGLGGGGAHLAKPPLGAFDRVALGVEQAADLEQHLDVLAAVEAVPCPRLAGPEDAELRFPVAQHVRLHPDQLRDLADLEVQLVGQRGAAHVAPPVAGGGPPPFIVFLSTWLALKVSTRRPEMTISSPVCGFRPFRGRFSFTTKLPKPEILTFSPCSRRSFSNSKIDSTTSVASFLEKPTFS